MVIGGGAAGFFCAVNAARLNPSLLVTIIEKSGKLLSKVKVSGGGRCNVTHACFDIKEMSRQYPRGSVFVKKSFHHFFTTETIQWFEERGVKIKKELDGRMFPITNTSQTIIDCLLKEASLYGVQVMLNTEVKLMSKNNDSFLLKLSNNRSLEADYVCVATGGYPKSSMFEWLTATGHTIIDPVPSLFTFNLPDHPIRELMGVSVENVKVKILSTKLEEEGPLLITHWGLSGPAVLRLSAWGARQLAAMGYHYTASINWLHGEGYNEPLLREMFSSLRQLNPYKKITVVNFSKLPQRLWQFLLEQTGVNPGLRFADLNKKTENLLIRNLVDYTVEVKGKTTFREEFVTAGGIHLSEIDHTTMMSKKIPGLFFAGEIMDVDGITGGFNFQHAWTSGFLGAQAIAGL